MPLIKGIQHRGPYSHSAASYSDYGRPVDSDEFTIKRQTTGRIRIFFKSTSAHSQGVGLLMPSSKEAIALGHALLMVAEGYATDITSSI